MVPEHSGAVICNLVFIFEGAEILLATIMAYVQYITERNRFTLGSEFSSRTKGGEKVNILESTSSLLSSRR